MKAIIQGHETALKESAGQWLPEQEAASVDLLADGRLLIRTANKTFTARLADINREDKTVTLYLDGRKMEVKIKEPMDDLLHAMGLDKMASSKAADVKAPMPGLVLNILVEPGTEVKKGDKLLVLEAMKMENIIKAGGDGKVGKIVVEKGQAVEKNQVLITFE